MTPQFDDAEHPSDVYIYAMLPTVDVERLDTEDSDNWPTWTTCLFQGTKPLRALTSTPSFSAPVPQLPDSHPRHRIGPSTLGAAAGLGVFATRALGLNDLIFAERPLLLSPLTFTVRDTPATRDALAPCLGMMSSRARAAFLDLYNAHPELDRVAGIIRTNTLLVRLGGDEELPESPGRLGTASCAVSEHLSRVNHRCGCFFLCDGCSRRVDDPSLPCVSSLLYPLGTTQLRPECARGLRPRVPRD